MAKWFCVNKDYYKNKMYWNQYDSWPLNPPLKETNSTTWDTLDNIFLVNSDCYVTHFKQTTLGGRYLMFFMAIRSGTQDISQIPSRIQDKEKTLFRWKVAEAVEHGNGIYEVLVPDEGLNTDMILETGTITGRPVFVSRGWKHGNMSCPPTLLGRIGRPSLFVAQCVPY